MYRYGSQYIDPSQLARIELPQTPLFDAAPRFLKDSFLYPYEEGFDFVQGLPAGQVTFRPESNVAESVPPFCFTTSVVGKPSFQAPPWARK